MMKSMKWRRFKPGNVQIRYDHTTIRERAGEGGGGREIESEGR